MNEFISKLIIVLLKSNGYQTWRGAIYLVQSE